MKRLIFCLSWLLLFCAAFAVEKEAKKETEDEVLHYHVVVTATRTEESRIEVGSTTTVIPAEELQKSGKKTVAEALTAVPGLEVARHGGIGKAASVFIRGANSEHTLVMIDGIELNDPISPSRSYDLAHLDLDNVERIEIVRGPQSTLYGSDALGGIIHIITRKGAGKPRFYLAGEAGAYDSYRESAGVSGGSEKVNYSLGISRFDSGGFSAAAEQYGNAERDDYGNTSMNARLGFKPTRHLDVDVTARYYDARNDIDNGAGPGADDANSVSFSDQLMLAGNARLSLLAGKWQQRLGVSFNRIKRKDENPFDELHPVDSSEGRYLGRIFKLDWQHNLFLHPGQTVTVGMEYEKEYGESEFYWQSAWGPGESLFPEKSASTVGLYLQDNVKLGNTLFATLGVRLDDHSLFGSQATYRIAPALVLKSGTRLKGSFGTGFKAPSLYQLYAPATAWGPIGNENLEPEKSKGWDIGIEQFLFKDRLDLGVTYFHNDFENLIQYDWVQGFVNVAQAQTRGVEVFFAVFPLKNIDLRAGYTYTKSEDKASGEKLLRRPEHRAHLALNWRFPGKAYAHIDVLYVGRRVDLFPYPSRVEAEPYTVVNLALSLRLSKNIELTARIDNLFDEAYEAVLGYGSAGRSAYIGFRLAN